MLEALEAAAVTRPELLGHGTQVGRDGGDDGATVALGFDQAEGRLVEPLELRPAGELHASQERLDARHGLRQVAVGAYDLRLRQQTHLGRVRARAVADRRDRALA